MRCEMNERPYYIVFVLNLLLNCSQPTPIQSITDVEQWRLMQECVSGPDVDLSDAERCVLLLVVFEVAYWVGYEIVY